MDADVFRASEGWRRLTGCRSEWLHAAGVLALAHPEDLPAIREQLERTLDTGEPYELEHRILHQGDGAIR